MKRTFEIDDWPRGAESALQQLDELHRKFSNFRCTVFAIPAEMTDRDWSELERRDWLRVGIHGYRHRKGECRHVDATKMACKLDEVLVESRWNRIFKAPWYGYNRAMFELLANREIPTCVIDYGPMQYPTPDGLEVWNAVQARYEGIASVRAHTDVGQGPPGRRTMISRLLKRGMTRDWSTADEWCWIDQLVRPALTKLNLGCGQQVWDGWDGLDPIVSPDSKVINWEWGQPLHYAACTVDVILISHSLLYCGAGEYRNVFSECWRVLQAGGVLRISEDETSRRIWRPAGTVHRSGTIRSEPTAELVREVLREVGFEVHQSRPGDTLSVHKDVLRGDTRHRLWRRGQKFYIEGVKRPDVPTKQTNLPTAIARSASS